MGGSNLEFTVYKAVLSALSEPTVITTIGGVLVAFGSGFFRVMKTFLRNIFGGLYKLTGGETEESTDEPVTKKSHDLTLQHVKQAGEITELLDELCGTLECQRVCVMQYHDGESFTLSNPMFKISVTYEATAPGFAGVARDIRNIPISTVPVLMNSLLLSNVPLPGVKEEKLCDKGGSCELRDTVLRIVSFTQKNLKLGNLRRHMEKHGIAKMYASSLTAANGGLLGILMIHFYDEEQGDKQVKKHICEICKVQQYLQLTLYKK